MNESVSVTIQPHSPRSAPQTHGGSDRRHGDPERAVGAGAGWRGHHQPPHRGHPGERGLDRGRLVCLSGSTVAAGVCAPCLVFKKKKCDWIFGSVNLYLACAICNAAPHDHPRFCSVGASVQASKKWLSPSNIEDKLAFRCYFSFLVLISALQIKTHFVFFSFRTEAWSLTASRSSR